MNPGVLGPSKVFFLFSILSVIAVFFVACYMKETKDLTNKDKKSVYSPSYRRREMDCQVGESLMDAGPNVEDVKGSILPK